MRTTLEIDDAVLVAAKEAADAQGISAGKVISAWARRGLDQEHSQTRKRRSGFPVFEVPAEAKPLTVAMVNSLIDDEGAPARR